jgi:outer membrane protein assembly factor BamA
MDLMLLHNDLKNLQSKTLISKINTVFGFIIIFLSFSTIELPSQEKGFKSLYPSIRNDELFEINQIVFEGNRNFTDEELMGLLSEQTSKRNKIHEFVEFYYFNFKKIKNINKYLPPGTMATFRKTLERWSYELRFYDQTKVESDIEQIKSFYNQKGFHEVKISFSFLPDENSKKNVLKFIVNEGKQYKLNNIIYLGLDSVASDVGGKLKGAKKLRKGNFFLEDEIVNEIRVIREILLNNGYYNCNFETPVVTLDTINKLDSLTIIFDIGNRYKISSIVFEDSLMGQKLVTNTMKSRQMSIFPGDWYSKKAIEESRQNLQTLGTFEFVSIDTAQNSENDDSTLAIKVQTRYRKQNEWGAGLYLNRTTYDYFTNLGAEGSYLNRNIGGIAQSLSTFIRGEFQDISRFFKKDLKPETEFQIGANYAQPLLWKIKNSKVGLAGQGLFSISKIFTDLQLNTASFQIRFPTKLPAWTYFNGMSFDLLLEWQIPINFDNALKTALSKSKSEADTQKTLDNFRIYQALNSFYDKNSGFNPTSFIFSFSIFGDSRDDLFNPTNGYFTNLSIDSWLGFGIAKYIRPQFSHNFFTSMNKSTVFAVKSRLGYIYWKDDKDSYIPADRQFYTGGANSLRGWESRHLRYTTMSIVNDTINGYNNFINDFIGSQMIIEGSFEIRWRIGRPRWASETVADIFNLFVMTGFVDWGNTFHWLAFSNKKYYSSMKAIDYLTGLAISAGLGIGFQTPVGPLRVDFSMPIYDPTPIEGLNKFVPNRTSSLKYSQIHLGLGYAF